MSGERGARALAGQHAGWVGHVREYVGAITPSDVTLYDPPLRKITVGGAGNIVLVLDGDSELIAGNYDTRAVEAGEIMTDDAIRQVRATGTTATTIKGYR